MLMKFDDPEIVAALKQLTPKEIAKYSKAFFARYYLGLDIPDHQEKWYSYCDRDRHLMLSPRDHGKTTVFCHAFPVWAICNIPNVRILLVSKTGGQANKLLGTIRNELRNNERIRKDYGNLILNKGGGPIWCVRDKEGRKLKDPTVEAVGAGGAITGGHFDIIISDDIIDDENTKTEMRMETMENWVFGTIGQLCEPWTQWIVTGTRKHYTDIYQSLLENPLWQKKIDQAIIKYPDFYEYVYSVNDDGQEYVSDVKIEGEYEVLWPEKWDIKTLLIDRLQTGPILFDREKQNDPSGMKGQCLNVDWLHYYDWKDIPLDELIFYIGGDLAISEEERADETVFCLMGYWQKMRRVFIIEFEHGRWPFPTQLMKIREFYTRCAKAGMRAKEVVLENNVYQKALAQQIAATTWIPAVGQRTDTNKYSKMVSIAPHFENKSVLLRRTELLGMPEFQKQWTQFPFAHDDMLDSVALIVLRLALGGNSCLGVAETDLPFDAIRPDDAYEYVFCGNCGEEYGTVTEKYPVINGNCDVCGQSIPKFPKHLMKVIA
jgi:predicted phage terminase large subunit-like protein